MDRSIPYGWVIEDEKSEIVGFLGNIPVKYQIKGINDIAAAGTSLYVRPSVRGVASLQPILAFTRQKNIKLLLNTTANSTVTKIFSKFGFSDLSAPFNDMEYWHIRDYGKMCEFYIQKNITSHRLLPAIEASLVPIKLISPFVRWFKDKRTFKLQPDHYKCSLCTDCDDS
ncbi:GNAT family N-acetyltransferase, partial [Methanococcoides sp. NM1]|uniref:GNAT family N-acetyltransferase n=1 Tax=Methanococcoides sp. NM1 TaxID=1201013 RepID=UPI001AEFCFBA